MKRLGALIILALAMLLPVGLSAGLFSAPDGVDWREESLTRQTSVGLGVWRAYWAAVDYDSGYSANYIFDPKYMF